MSVAVRLVILSLALGLGTAATAQRFTPVEQRFHVTDQLTIADMAAFWSEEELVPYRSAAFRHPDLVACGTGSGTAFAFRPNQPYTQKDLEICLFLLAEDLTSPAAMEGWMRAQGFEAKFDPGLSTGPDRLSAYLDFGDLPAPFADHLGFVARHGGAWWGWTLGISVAYAEAGHPMGVNVTTFTK